MNIKTKLLFFLALLALSTFSYASNEELYTLTVKVDKLRNSKGVVQFSLYIKAGSIPDKDHKNYYKTKTGIISGASSSVMFIDLPEGSYAVTVFHDENLNGKIDKGFMLPKEGVGFTNYKSISFANRPSFKGASFELQSSIEKSISIIYF